MFSLTKAIANYKYRKDIERGVKIIDLLRKYHSNELRKDFVFETVLKMDFTTEELDQLANEFGQLAHDRARRENEPNDGDA